ncbi:MAG: hypothetical protein HOV92_36990 [Streptomyces sp.]|nr:hypothetical protein [Streptomyces sp.]
MTAATTRPVPTPLNLAGQRPATPPAPAARPADAPLYDRVRWEQAVMASGMHNTARLVGLTLAHYALGGYLPADGIQHTRRLSARTGLAPERARQCLRDLERAGLIARPASADWEHREQPRPITLTLPRQAPGTEPPHTGGADA